MKVSHLKWLKFLFTFDFSRLQHIVVGKLIKLYEKRVLKLACRLHRDHKEFVKLNGLLRLEIAAPKNADFEEIRVQMNFLHCCMNWAKDTVQKLKKEMRKYKSLVKFVLGMIGSDTKFSDRIPKIEPESKKLLCKVIPDNFKKLFKKTKYLYTEEVNSSMYILQ